MGGLLLKRRSHGEPYPENENRRLTTEVANPCQGQLAIPGRAALNLSVRKVVAHEKRKRTMRRSRILARGSCQYLAGAVDNLRMRRFPRKMKNEQMEKKSFAKR